MKYMQDNLWMHTISCCRFVDGGASTNATFKPGRTNINWVLPWGIEMLVIFGNKRASKLTNWLVSVETHDKVVRHYMHTIEMKKCKFIRNKVVERIVKMSIEKATLIPHTNVTHGIDDSNKTSHAWMVQSQQHPNMTYKVPLPFTKYVYYTCE